MPPPHRATWIHGIYGFIADCVHAAAIWWSTHLTRLRERGSENGEVK